MTGEPEGTAEHRKDAATRSARCAVVIISDKRTVATDESGPLARHLLESHGHTVEHFILLPNHQNRIREEIGNLIARDDLDVIILSGGTGLGVKDRTVEAIEPLIEKHLPGFGELFRMVSYEEQIGPAAMLTRAVAGSARGHFIVSLPGSKAAVELALTKLLLPELRHILHELTR